MSNMWRFALASVVLGACGPTSFEQLDKDGDGALTSHDLEVGECAVVLSDSSGNTVVQRTKDGGVWESTPSLPWWTPTGGFGWLEGARQTNVRCPLPGADWADLYGTLFVGTGDSAAIAGFHEIVVSRPEDRSLLNGFKVIDGELEDGVEPSIPVTMTLVDTDNDLFSGWLNEPVQAAFHDYETDLPTAETLTIVGLAFREAQQ